MSAIPCLQFASLSNKNSISLYTVHCRPCLTDSIRSKPATSSFNSQPLTSFSSSPSHRSSEADEYLRKGCKGGVRPLPLDPARRRWQVPSLSRRKLSAMAAKSEEEEGKKKHVIVCGGGVIGVCTAYYLATHGARVTIVERDDVAGGASGKAGGLLGLDWYDGEPIGDLARQGFLLHAELARQLDGPSAYKYAALGHISVNLTPPPADLEAALPPVAEPAILPGGVDGDGEDTWDAGFAILGEKPDLPVEIPDWLDGPVAADGGMVNGTNETIALLHPGLFTKRLMAEAMERYGATLRSGTVQRIVFDDDASHPETRSATGVVVNGALVEGDAVVVALGPWSGGLEPISSLCRFRALRGDSIVMRPEGSPLALGPCVSFFLPESVSDRVEEFYMMPRSTGEVYVGGINRLERGGLPESTAAVTPDPQASESLAKLAGLGASSLRGASIEVTQACLRPFAGDDSLPLIGTVPHHSGLYVATGHGYWGILNGPATGLAMAELVLMGSSSSLDLEPYNPGRFRKAVEEGA